MLAITYPSWIQPEIFPGVPFLGLVRWYGLMYIFAFATAFFVTRKLLKENFITNNGEAVTEDDFFSCFTTGILFLLIGARIFSTLVYDSSGKYLQKPWLIFWPFDEQGAFTGLAGMSYHGGFIGAAAGVIFWCLTNKKNPFKWLDLYAIAIPAGYTFGRLGNFLNGELFGRITTVPWGMIFPNAQKYSYSIPHIAEIAEKAGVAPMTGSLLVNLPRHPSQLYEAFFEGIFLFVVLWLLRKYKPFDGFFASLYAIGYGLVRFVIEYFREPDVYLGYKIEAVKNAPTYMNVSFLNISTGQIFCMGMIGLGLLYIVIRVVFDKIQYPKRHPDKNRQH